MHLRRALLLFAIVLGLAAIAASVSRPRDEARERAASPTATQTERTPTASPGTEGGSEPSKEVTLDASRRQSRRISVGQPASVLVQVDEPGLVEIAELGLSGVADPLTPARFEVFATEPGRHDVSFVPAGTAEARAAGTLVVQPSAR